MTLSRGLPDGNPEGDPWFPPSRAQPFLLYNIDGKGEAADLAAAAGNARLLRFVGWCRADSAVGIFVKLKATVGTNRYAVAAAGTRVVIYLHLKHLVSFRACPKP